MSESSATARPTVLFVCVKNGGKSQMAAALMRHIAGNRVDVYSAGTTPGSKLNEESRASVEALGASFDGEYPKAVDADLLGRADRVIVVGTEAQLPADCHENIEVWAVDEPSERGIEGEERMTLIRTELLERVEKLAAELG